MKIVETIEKCAKFVRTAKQASEIVDVSADMLESAGKFRRARQSFSETASDEDSCDDDITISDGDID